jgi:hypothetical protein
MPGSPAQLYEQDFVLWTEQQAAALRQAAALGLGGNLPLDWENLAEEIDSLGRSLRRELRSRIAVIIEHLIKLEASPAADPGRGWIETIGHERSEIELLLDDAPSLKGEVSGMIASGTPRAIHHVTRALRLHGEANAEVVSKIAAAGYSEEQVLGGWFPGDAPHPDPLPANGEREECD